MARIYNQVKKWSAIQIIIALWITGMVISIAYTLITDRPVLTLTEQRELISATHFEQLWSRTNLNIIPNTWLVAENDCVAVVTVNRWLNCLDQNDGDRNWRTRVPDVQAIANDHDFIFVASNGPHRRCSSRSWSSQCELINISTYDLKSGHEKWSINYPGMLIVSTMSVDSDSLNITGGGGHGYYHSSFVIEPDTGLILDYQEYEREKIESTFPNFRKPAFIAGKGKLMSNVFSESGISYFFVDDTTLWAYDEMTQEAVGSAIFSSSQNLLGPDNVRIVARENLVFVYFNQSQQIFALRLMR